MKKRRKAPPAAPARPARPAEPRLGALLAAGTPLVDLSLWQGAA